MHPHAICSTHLQVQNTIYRDGEELAAVLQAHDSLQGAVATTEGGSAPPYCTHSVLSITPLTDTGASKVCWERMSWLGPLVEVASELGPQQE